jgi:hypothetical protein
MQQRQEAIDALTNQKAANQYMHAMWDDRAKDAAGKPLTREQQIQMANDFIKSRIQQAKAATDPARAAAALGDATHTAQEPSSPSHRGFPNWHPQSTKEHLNAERQYPAAGTPERAGLEGATQWIYDIYTGKAGMPDNFFDPKTGSFNLPESYLKQPAEGDR